MKQLVCLVALAACVVPPTTPYGSMGGPVAQGGGEMLGCTQIFECYAGCGEDGGCYDTCRGRGDVSAQAAVDGLVACSTDQCANDSSCVTTTCSAEIQACTGAAGTTGGTVAAGGPAPGNDPRQPHTTENLLPWLVGDWIASNHQYQFFADSTVRRSSGAGYVKRNGEYGCVYTINEIGTVTQEGDMLIMVFPETAANNCGDKEVTAGLTVRYRIEWIQNPYADDPNVLELQLRDIDCTNGDMWCVDRMRRR